MTVHGSHYKNPYNHLLEYLEGIIRETEDPASNIGRDNTFYTFNLINSRSTHLYIYIKKRKETKENRKRKKIKDPSQSNNGNKNTRLIK